MNFYKKESVMKNEKGIVLILSLLMLTVLSIIAMGLLTIALKENQVAANYRNHTQAFYSAEAGLNIARQSLKVTPDWTTIVQGSTVDCSGQVMGTCSYTFDEVKSDLVIVTATAQFQMGRSTQRSSFSRTSLPFPPGGITSLGLPGTVAFNGNAFVIDGNNWVPPTDDGMTPAYQDNGACAVTVPKFGIAVKDPATQLLVKSGLTAPQQDNVIGDAPNPPWGPPSPTPSIGVDNSLTNAEILALADKLMLVADTTYAPGTALAGQTLGDQANPKIVAVDGTGYGGDPVFTLNASTGAGVLIVKNGTLRLAGNTQWTGLVLLVGENAKLDMAGGGDKAIYGSVVIVETLNPSATIAAGGGNLKVRYSCDGLDVAAFASSSVNGAADWWTEVR